jgi:ElaB/YqjD/DUF883 family membrane-anchored ribosome-binding protein
METYFGNIEHAHGDLARERVLTDLKNLARDTEDLLKATAVDLGGKAAQARSRVAAALERAKATCNELQTEAVATAKATAHRTDAIIREHPYESIGVAFGFGLLIGALIGRK